MTSHNVDPPRPRTARRHEGGAMPGYSDTVTRILAAARQRYAFPPQAGAEAEGGRPRIVRQSFSVANEAVTLQAPAWSDYVSRILQVSVSRAQVASGFRGEIDTYVLEDMIFLDSRTDPFIQSRTTALISTDTLRDYVFHVALEGIVETEIEAPRQRKAAQFVPGILALDMNQPMRMVRPSYAKVLAFFLPRAVVEAQIIDAPRIHGSVVGYTTPLARLLLDHLRALHRDLRTMAPEAAETALRVAAELIVAAFAKQARLSSGARAAARAAMLGKIQRHVRAHLHRRELSPESVLQSFALPRPTLYRMFESEGGLAAYIRNCRLREAADELALSPGRAVGEIAESLAFSASDFTRAFRRSYGVAPQAFREFGADLLRA
jgi:AraC-like DNA-binding protein